MRGICLVLALLGVPAIAAAQYVAPVQRGSAVAPIAQPLPSLGLPLPSIGLPPRGPVEEPRRGNPGQQRGAQQRDGHQRDWQQREWLQRDWQQQGWQQRDDQQRDDQLRNGRSRGFANPYGLWPGPTYVYVGQQPYPWVGMPSTQVITQGTTVPGMITVVPEPMTGRIRLEVEPADILQVFVDGAYVGTPADLGSELELQPGSRRIEFRAPGYKTLTIDAQIVSERTIVYRATLDRIAPTRVIPPPVAPAAPPAPPPAPSGNRTMYLIPGCYMGNVPPQDLKLPAGCDLKRLTTLTP